MIAKVGKKAEPNEEEHQRQTLQRLANAVRDEQHWQDILAAAETPESRDELERLVGPKLRFRRACPCTTPECESGDPGLWQPVLEVRSPMTPNAPAWVPIELRLCEGCKSDAEVQHFLTDAIWRQILHQWAVDDPPPVKRLTTLKFDRVH